MTKWKLRPLLCNYQCEIEYSEIDAEGHFIVDRVVKKCERHMHLSDKEVAAAIISEGDFYNDVVFAAVDMFPEIGDENGWVSKEAGTVKFYFDQKGLLNVELPLTPDKKEQLAGQLKFIKNGDLGKIQ